MTDPDRSRAPASPSPLLDIHNLTVSYRSRRGWLDAVREVSLRLYQGETLGLVGESGSGKTTLVMAVMRSLSENGAVRQGRIELDGRDLLSLTLAEMRPVWGRQMALVPQNPQSALNPSIQVGEQLDEILRLHEGLSQAAARRRALGLLETVHLADPERVAASYPHQISGGMQQRVMIAMALSLEPKLLVLDEPTTDLDVTTQATILDLIRELIDSRQTAVLYVTHNLGVVAQLCDRVAVMYAGEMVEEASVRELFDQPRHPYTRGLLGSIPRLGETKYQTRRRSIDGQIPPLGERPGGCVFRPRCPLAVEVCLQRPPLYEAGPGRVSRCHRWEDVAEAAGNDRANRDFGAQGPGGNPRGPSVLAARDIHVHFPLPRSPAETIAGTPRRMIRAVNGISLEIPPGSVMGLVGESGSGKTTLARAVMGLVETSAGELDLLGLPLPPRLSQRDLETLRRLQMVFQSPDEAFNPYWTVGESLRRPLITLLKMSRREARDLVPRLLEAVRLPPATANRLPAQLSGGELQRAAIARTFASNPSLLVADEPVSSLDVSVQAVVLNLLNDLQAASGNSLLFISHDLSVLGYVSDQIAVMYLGSLMEVAKAGDLFEPPYHPYTEALLSAVPLVEPGARQMRIRLEGEIPSPANIPSGCPFHTRCPRFLGDICVEETPPWRVDERTGKRYFCHIPVDDLLAAQPRALTVKRHISE
ncbi:MAG: ABC transporter ATP-binding protein [Chloroflexota bacterium]|nr:MAG: ABC transporter ATP-binding protein [Chloroflexota bacterium]